MSDKDILADAMEDFDLCVERESENRINALDDIRFARLAEQWPDKVKKSRQDEGRPCLTINRLPAFIRQVVNDARQNSPSITVHPVDNKADKETAEIINGLIRNIEVTSDAEVAYDTALEYAVTGGFGYFRINLAYADDDTFDQDIRIRRVANPFSVYGDPYSTSHDSSDWNTAFVVDSMTKDAFEKKYKGAEAVDWKSDGYTGLRAPWLEGETIQVAERWCREQSVREIVALNNGEVVDRKIYEANKDRFDASGTAVVGSSRKVPSHKVKQYVMTGAEVLETIDWVGKYIPIIPVYGEDINVEGKRHLRSMVRDAKDPQQMFNYWRTAATELVALAPKAPWIGKTGTFKTDNQKWTTANTQSHSFIEYDGEAPQRQPFAGVPAGALQEALNASDDMKAIMGMFDASLGAQSNETSGRAILARQKEGDVSSFHFIDNLSRSIRHAGRVIIDLIPHVYSSERIIRVMGVDGEQQSVPVNQPVIVQPQQPGQPQLPPQPVPQAPPGQPPVEQINPDLIRIFDLTVGKYDLTVETGPSFTTQREAAASQMMELLRVFPQAAPVIGDILAENLDWPGASEIAERLKQLTQRMLGAASGVQGQPQQQMLQMQQTHMDQLMALQKELLDTKAQLSALQGDKSVDDDTNRIKAYDAETKRLHAIAEANKPSHLPRATSQQFDGLR